MSPRIRKSAASSRLGMASEASRRAAASATRRAIRCSISAATIDSLVREELVERADADPGPLGDPGRREGLVALLPQKPSAGLEHGLVGGPGALLAGQLSRLEIRHLRRRMRERRALVGTRMRERAYPD